jgi:guanylate kinase
MNKGRLFVISGPSGTGKGTICKELIKDDKIRLSVSMTTRNPREGEVHGVSYYFATKEEFLQKIDAGGFLEYAEVFGNYYGTPKMEVLELLDEGIDVLLEIDVQGALQIKDVYPEAVLVFILPPSMEELRARLTGRGTEPQDVVERRLGEAAKEISYVKHYDYAVINDDLEEAIENVKTVIKASHFGVTQSIVDQYEEEF